MTQPRLTLLPEDSKFPGPPSGLIDLLDLGIGEKGVLHFSQFPQRLLVALLPEPPGGHQVVGLQVAGIFIPSISAMIATSRR